MKPSPTMESTISAEHPQQKTVSTMDSTSDLSTSTSESMKKFNMYYTTSRFNVRLHAGKSSTPASYYVQCHISFKEPQILLRRGQSKTAPMVAFARFRNMSRHMLIGHGDCQKDAEEHLLWEELRREKNLLHCSDYIFGTAIGSTTGKREEFRWVKDKHKVLKTVYECRGEKGEVVARLLSGGALNWNKGGEVEVADGVDESLEEMLIVSAMGIWVYEAFNYQSLRQGFDNGDEKAKGV